jgi:alpha-tubulin suppressor-like RCC1 family protein
MTAIQRISTIALLAIAAITLPTKADSRDDSRAIKASGGEDHTLVLTADKGAWACGPNGGYDYNVDQYYYGVLGTASNDYGLVRKSLVRVHGPDDVNYLGGIDDIDAGWKHSLALDVNGFVWSWGWNSHGQLGIGSLEYKTAPVLVFRGDQPDDPCEPSDYLKHVIGISAGRSGEHSLAVDANGFVYAWGRNQEGQCGVALSGTGFKELDPNQVLRGEQPFDPNRPSVYLNRIIAVSAGEWHSMALEAYDPDEDDPNLGGRVYTWGDNYFVLGNGNGVLGHGMDSNSTTPVLVVRGEQDYNEPNHVYLKDIVAISAGWDHSMALEEDDPWDPNHKGRVYAWGNNGQGWAGWFGERSEGGRLGDGSTDSNDRPVLVLSGEQDPPDPNSPLKHITVVSAGEGHSMALDANGYVYCWGDNQYGQLGDGTNDQNLVPVKVVGQDRNRNGIHDANEGYLGNIMAISAGYWHSLAIDANGVIWTWGKGSAGRLGLGNKTIDCNTPHPIPVVYNITQETFAFAIQTAIDDANDAGDTLEASPGTYYENVNFRDKSVTLRSADPGDANVVADTIVDARYNAGGTVDDYYAVNFNNGSGSSVAGLTLTASVKGGVNCVNLSSAYLSNCVIQDNSWDGIYSKNSSVDMRGCEIRRNASGEDREYCGIYCESGSDVNVVNCVVADNDGNGICCHESNVLITNSTIYGNENSGIDFDSISAELRSNLIYENGISGIKIYNCSGPEPNVIVVNNTIVGDSDYGIYSTEANDVNMVNCIVYGNGDDANDNLYAGDSQTFLVNYSCLEGTPVYDGTENINSDPCFFDDVNDDYHLSWESPCVNTGDPNFEDANETDIDGNPRVIGGRVDMGADEDYRHCDPNDYAEWVEVGRPNCWMWDYQCDGDADGINSGVPFYYRVYTGDMALIIANWMKKAGDQTLNACADIDHISSGAPFYYRVYTGDVAKVIANWRKKDGDLPGNCANRGCQRGALGGGRAGTQLTSKELLGRLAEIWLDPEVQKSIDEEEFLKVYESLKEP